MANPLLLLGRALLGSELQRQAAPYLPTGIQQLLPSQSLAQNLAKIPSFLGYLTGLKQEQPSGNLPTDYMVSPTGIVDTSGGQMITDQGVSGFQPRDQYTMDIPYNPATDTMGRDPELEAYMQQMREEYARMPTGSLDTSPMTTQVPSSEFESWWNPIDVMDLLENLPTLQPQEEEEELYESGSPMSYAPPKPLVQMTQPSVMR